VAAYLIPMPDLGSKNIFTMFTLFTNKQFSCDGGRLVSVGNLFTDFSHNEKNALVDVLSRNLARVSPS
jgi:hypothetical protein